MTGAVLPPSGNLVVRASDWKAGAAPGEQVRVLVDDPSGYRTLLMRYEPGPLGTPHAHDQIEQIYVLEGDFFDDDGSYGPGDFILRLPGTMHRAGSHGGGTMMLVYSPAVLAA